MKSKMLLVSNIVASLYSAFLVIWFVIINGDELTGYFKGLDILGSDAKFILILLWIHIGLFALGCIFGWLSYITKKSGKAKFAAIVFLIGTILFPIYFFVSIPITIISFIGYSKQKKLEKSSK